MSVIEGVGDEVIHFFGLFVTLLVCFVAWWSRRVREYPQIRTVWILERRSQILSNGEQPNVNRIDNDQNTQRPSRRSVPVTSDRTTEEASGSEPLMRNGESSSTDSNKKSENDQSGTHTNQSTSDGNAEAASDNIRIRLKYLNDEQKLVEGRLQELLGDFKRRHFRMELSAQKLVRLIFNGQVLHRDDLTLQRCGLYDNCVVHCLIHTQQNTNRSNNQQHVNSPPPDWNLGGLLYACLCVILGFAWICRYNYSHLFNLTSTTALFGLTAMFIVSVIGVYLPPQTVQNN